MPLFNSTLLPHTIDVYLGETSHDATGGPTVEYVDQRLGVPCFVQPPAPDVTDRYGRNDVIIKYSIYLIDQPTFVLCDTATRFVFEGVNLQLAPGGAINMCNLDRYFRIDVTQERA